MERLINNTPDPAKRVGENLMSIGKNPQGQPLVSICIPTYNQELTIRQTLDSAINQTYSNIEILVSDHNSSDKTREMVCTYLTDSRLKILDFLGPREAHLNWNFVSSRANGDYLCLLPGDDIISPDSIEKKVSAFLANSTVVMVASRRSVIDADGKQLIASRGLRGMRGVYLGDAAIRKCVANGSNIFGEPMCVMLQSEKLREVGGWPAELPYVIDQSTYIKILERGDFFAIPEVLASFRLSERQMSYRSLSSQAHDVRRLHWQTRNSQANSVGLGLVLVGNFSSFLLAIARRIYYLLLRSEVEETSSSIDWQPTGPSGPQIDENLPTSQS